MAREFLKAFGAIILILESGNIVVSDINRGFFLIRKSGTLETPEFSKSRL